MTRRASVQWAIWAAVMVVYGLGSLASAQDVKQWIDCTGSMTPSATTSVYPSFQDYLSRIGPVGTVYVNGTCPGYFTIWNADNFYINGPGEINGRVDIGNSLGGVFLKNMTITNSNGDGIYVNGSKVMLESCNVSNNAGNGVSVDNASHVLVIGSGTFNYNGGWAGGFHVFGHSFLNISPQGPVEIRGNDHSGIWASESDLQVGFQTLISDNKGAPGVVLLGGSRAQFGGDLSTPSVVENNPNGGIMLGENSEISLYGWIVRKNGAFGISSGLQSQLTLASALVTENTGPGVNIYSGSQLDFYPGTQNKVSGNGSLTDPMSAGVRVDGNSAVFLRGGEISNNLGAGIRLTLNSSADFSGINLGGNTTPIVCDLSSQIAADVSVPLSSGCIAVRKNH